MRRRWRSALAALIFVTAIVGACSNPSEPPQPDAGSGDVAFRQLAGEILEYTYKQDPSNAISLGIHSYDDLIPDRSAAAVKTNVEAIKSFRSRLDAVDAESLSPEAQLDLELTKRTLDGRLLRAEVIRPWAKDPDSYSSGVTNDAFVMISRTFAPPEQRLRSLTSRMRLMPDSLAQARTNLDNPPRIYTEIAIEQIDGNRDFFAQDVPAAFDEVKDQTLLAEFRTANDAVVAALDDYKAWLVNELLPRSDGSFAYGADTY